jgi:hypothetical protein
MFISSPSSRRYTKALPHHLTKSASLSPPTNKKHATKNTHHKVDCVVQFVTDIRQATTKTFVDTMHVIQLQHDVNTVRVNLLRLNAGHGLASLTVIAKMYRIIIVHPYHCDLSRILNGFVSRQSAIKMTVSRCADLLRGLF